MAKAIVSTQKQKSSFEVGDIVTSEGGSVVMILHIMDEKRFHGVIIGHANGEYPDGHSIGECWDYDAEFYTLFTGTVTLSNF